MLLFAAACFIPSFLIAFLVTAAMRKIAPKVGLIDQPAARKVHVTPTPLGGGLGIVAGFMIPVAMVPLVAWGIISFALTQQLVPEELQKHLAGIQYRTPLLGAIIIGGLLLAVTGLIDDLRPVSWKLRLALQFLISCAMVMAGVRITVFLTYPIIGDVMTVVWLMILINSFNFLDNMDGLSGGIALIASVVFASIMLTFLDEPRWLVGGCLLILIGSISGFLVHNWPPAKIFMGDAGSTFIGFLMGCLTVLGTFYSGESGKTHVILAPLCVLAIPLYDTLTVLVIRFRRGTSPFQADKNHFSHRLVEIGLTRTRAVMTIHFATMTTGLGGLLLYRVSDWSSATLVIALVFCVLAIVTILERAARHKDDPSDS